VCRMEGIGIRWYPPALDPRSGTGTNDPYLRAHDEIGREIGKSFGQAFLAYDHFPMPDRHARGETTLEAISRTVGLDLGEKARPFLPLVDSDRIWTEGFLKEKGLEEGRFAVLAPFSWPNKMWPRERFSCLIDTLREKHNLPSVLVAYPEVGPFDNPGVVMAYDLSIGQIGGLLARAGLYVGLDSGPSHMAAALDLPMVVIFVERKTIPFEVRALSPWALHVVEGFEKKLKDPSLNTVEEAVSYVWTHRRDLPEAIPQCPACLRKAHYIAGTNGRSLEYLCVCGLKMTHDPGRETCLPKSVSGLSRGAHIFRTLQKEKPANRSIRLTVTSSLASLASCRETEKDFRTHPYVTVEAVLDSGEEVPKGSALDSDSGPCSEIRWSQDALVFWMARLGYLPQDVEIRKGRYPLWVFIAAGKDKKSETPGRSRVTIPWSGGALKLSRSSDYLRWYSFEKWGRPSDLVGVVKSLSSLGYLREAFSASCVAFRADPSLRSLRWLGKSFYFFLFGRRGSREGKQSTSPGA